MASYIDHTILKPDATRTDIDGLCKEAVRYNFKSVCVNSNYTKYASEKLKGASVDVCSVIGFPLGAMSKQAKAFEAAQASEEGAAELDMVLNIGDLKSGKFKDIEEDIISVRNAAPHPVILKVIIETCLLTDEEKVKACEIVKKAGADFVKTSTGFSNGGAMENDIILMRKTVGPDFGVKASGGIKNREDAMVMINAGATRIGTSSGVSILKG